MPHEALICKCNFTAKQKGKDKTEINFHIFSFLSPISCEKNSFEKKLVGVFFNWTYQKWIDGSIAQQLIQILKKFENRDVTSLNVSTRVFLTKAEFYQQ